MATTAADRLHLSGAVLPGLLPSIENFNLCNKTAPADSDLASRHPIPHNRLNQSMEGRSDGRTSSTLQDSSREDAEITMCICPVCGYSASSPRGQDEHMDTVHGEGRLTFASPTVMDEQPSPGGGYSIKPHERPNFGSAAVVKIHDNYSPSSGAQVFSTSQPTSSGSDSQIFCGIPCVPTAHSGAAMSLTPGLASTMRSDDSLHGTSSSVTREKTLECSRWSARLSYKASECDSSSGDTATAVTLQQVDSRRRYRCNMCSETFPWHGDLAEHLRLVHGMQKTRENARSAKAGSFCCVHCKYVAKYQSELRRHMRLHWGVKPFVCVFCPYRSAWKGDLKRHMESHHRERFTSEAELIKIMSQFKNNAGTTLNGVPLSANLNKDSFSHGDMSQGKSNDSADLSPKARDTSSDEGDTGMSSGKADSVAKHSLTERNELRCNNCSYRASTRTQLRGHVTSCNRLKQCYRCPICGHDSLHEWEARIHLNSRHSAFTIAPVAVFDVARKTTTVEHSNTPLLNSPDSPRSLHIDTLGVVDGMERSSYLNSFPSVEWSMKKEQNNAQLFGEHECDTVPIDLSISQKSLLSSATELVQTREVTGVEKTAVSSLTSTATHLIAPAGPSMGRFTPMFPTSPNLPPLPPPPLLPLQPPKSQVQTISTDLTIFPKVEDSYPAGWTVEPTDATVVNTGASGVPSTQAVNMLFNQWFMSGLMHSWQHHQQQTPNFLDPSVIPQADTTLFPFAKIDPNSVPSSPWVTQTTPSDHVIVTKQSPLDLHNPMPKEILKSSIGSLRVSTGWSEPDTFSLSSNSNLPLGTDLKLSPFSKHRDSQRARRGRRSGQLRHGERLSIGIGSKDEQWKRHQCSGCGHRSNWKWDINKHIKVAHPERTSITTVTLDLEEAKRTFGEYMNRLKLSRNRYLTDGAEGTREQYSWQSGSTPVCPFGQPAEGYYRPYQCSTCGHRSNWKWDVRKHIKQIHDNKAEVITLSLEEARRTIHQYKNCRRQQTRHTDLKTPTWYNSSEIVSTPTNYSVDMSIKANVHEMIRENSMHRTERKEDRRGPRQLKSLKTDEQVYSESKNPASSSVVSTSRFKGTAQRYPCRVCHMKLPTQRALMFHLSFRHSRSKNAVYSSLYARRKSPRSMTDEPLRSNVSNTDDTETKSVNMSTSYRREADDSAVLSSDIVQSNSFQTTLTVGTPSLSNDAHFVNTQINTELQSSDSICTRPWATTVQPRARFARISHRFCAGNEQATSPLSSISLTNQQCVKTMPCIQSPKPTGPESTCVVRQMSALLDELLSLLGDTKGVCTAHEIVTVSTKVSEPRDTQDLSHRVAGLIRDVVVNTNTPTEINVSNCSSSSNEENHPMPQHVPQGKPEPDSVIHTILRHPEVGTRLLRLANVLHSVPNMTNYA